MTGVGQLAFPSSRIREKSAQFTYVQATNELHSPIQGQNQREKQERERERERNMSRLRCVYARRARGQLTEWVR